MRRLLPALIAAMCGMALSGCVEAVPEFRATAGDLRSGLAASSHGTPQAATVAILSLTGAPDPVSSQFSQAFAKAAAAREITTADASTAHYLVRGYLSASAGDEGTDVTYVYDVFDANDQQRLDRLTDTLSVPAKGADPWAQATDQVVTSLAGHSADALASMLAESPVARAATVADNSLH